MFVPNHFGLIQVNPISALLWVRSHSQIRVDPRISPLWDVVTKWNDLPESASCLVCFIPVDHIRTGIYFNREVLQITGSAEKDNKSSSHLSSTGISEDPLTSE